MAVNVTELGNKLRKLRLVGIKMELDWDSIGDKEKLKKLGIEAPVRIKDIDSKMKRLSIPEGVDFIYTNENEDKKRFKQMKEIETVVLPESLKGIGKSVFMGSDIKNINIPRGLVEIGNWAFKDCKRLRYIELYKCDKLIRIGEEAFMQSGLDGGVRLARSITDIGEAAFKECSRITSVDFNRANVYNIPKNCFSNSKALRNVINLGEVCSVDDCSFEDCTALEKVDMPKSLSKLGNKVFNNAGLLRMDLSNTNLKEIGDYCFDECNELRELLFPETLEKYGYRSVYRCTKLEELDLSKTNIKGLNVGDFTDIAGEFLRRVILPKRFAVAGVVDKRLIWR